MGFMIVIHCQKFLGTPHIEHFVHPNNTVCISSNGEIEIYSKLIIGRDGYRVLLIVGSVFAICVADIVHLAPLKIFSTMLHL